MSASFYLSAKGLARFQGLAGAIDFKDETGPGAQRLLKEAARIDGQQNLLNFRTSGAASGPAWKENGPRYKAFKQRAVPGRGPLRLTDRLRQSLADSNHPERVKRIKKGVIELGTRVPYAAKHLRNHRAPRFTVSIGRWDYDSLGPVNVPARNFLQRDERMRTQLIDLLARHIKKHASQAWSRANGGNKRNLRNLGLGDIDRLVVVVGARGAAAVRPSDTVQARGPLRRF